MMKEMKRTKLFLMQATHDSPTGRKVCRHKKNFRHSLHTDFFFSERESGFQEILLVNPTND